MAKHKRLPIEEPLLNMERVHFQTVIHQIRVTGTWLKVGPGQHTPCLVLTDGRKDIRRCIPCVIPLETSWIWAFHGDIGSPELAMRSLSEWVGDGLLPGEKHHVPSYMAIVDAVNSRLPDLIAMPPRPQGDIITVGDITIRNAATGKIIAEQEMTSDV